LKLEKRTNEELEDLKKQWLADGCWDIEDTEGFEAHHDELLAWRKDLEREYERKAEELVKKRAAKNLVSPRIQRQIDHMNDHAMDSRHRAQRLLQYQLKKRDGVTVFGECEDPDIEGIVNAIVDAAHAVVWGQLIKCGIAGHLPARQYAKGGVMARSVQVINLEVAEAQTIQLAGDGEILSVMAGLTGRGVQLYVLQSEKPTTGRPIEIEMYDNGKPISEGRKFIGTFYSGFIAKHVFAVL
jgi:RNA polymerase-binding transcription factor DksA